jgi:hypothetical protein
VASVALAALISIVGLQVGPREGVVVWTGTPSGLRAARLVPKATSPVLSPDGRKVMYVVRGELRVQAVGGGPARTLTQVSGTQPAFAWSPNGMRIAFVAEDAIIQVPLVGKGLVRRIPLPTSWGRSQFAALTWSSAGGLAFSRTYGDGKAGTLKNELDYVDAQGAAGVLYRNRTPYSSQLRPVFSPDGSQIVVQAGEGGGLVSVPTGLGRRRTLTKGYDSDPVWSPDGQWIAFTRGVPRGVSDVWLVRADGTGLHKLTTTPIPPRGVPHTGSMPLAWSPDGKQLLCFRHDGFAVVDVATRASRRLRRVGTQSPPFAARWL